MQERIIPRLPRPVRRRLERARKATHDAEYRTRIQIVLSYNEGYGTTTIARLLGTVPSRAIGVLHRFRDCGEDGLVDRRSDNGQSKVDEDLKQALYEMLENTPLDFGWHRPTWTRELMTKELEAATGVEVSIRTVGRMLGELDARWGCAKPVVFCPWSQEQKERRLRAIRRRLSKLGPGEFIFFVDELDIHLNPRIGRDWTLPRTQRLVPTPGQNRKMYVAGALAADGSDLFWVTSDRKNSKLFIALLEELPNARHIHVILDNFAIHSSREVQKYLNEHPHLFQLHFLPPYCPDHNAIERLWREVHANVTRNHRCSTMETLMANVFWFLRQEARRRRRVAAADPESACGRKTA